MNANGKGQAVVVTGASTGIGRAVATHLAGLGYKVYAGVRKEADAESIRAEGSDNLVPLTIEVTDEDSIAAARDLVASQVGDAGLAALINNAGVVVTAPVEFLSQKDLRRQMEVNLFGAVAVTQAFLGLIRTARGRIINIGSIGGRMPIPFTGAYAASKSALASINDALRMELKPWGIEVVLIEPGAIRTPIWEKGRNDGDAARAAFGEEGQALYGTSMDKLRDMANTMEGKAVDPAVAAEIIGRAVTDPKPKARIIIGRDAKGQAIMKKFLPDPIVDGLVLGQIGLPKGPAQ